LTTAHNILLVKQKLGHANINTILLYAQIIDVLHEDSYTCEIAETTEQAKTHRKRLRIRNRNRRTKTIQKTQITTTPFFYINQL
jgi:hypothetical protein